jgi:hypothetical protein
MGLTFAIALSLQLGLTELGALLFPSAYPGAQRRLSDITH